MGSVNKLPCGDAFENMPDSIFDTLKKTSVEFGDKTALCQVDGRHITYTEFYRRAESFSAVLAQKYQVKKGDICAILCVNSIDFCIAFYSIVRLGAIALPLSTKFKSNDLVYPLCHSGCEVLILDEEWRTQIQPVFQKTKLKHLIFTGMNSLLENGSEVLKDPPEVRPEDGAVIMYTSGTTGKPKAAYITHFNVLHAVECYRQILGLDCHDKTVISIPIFNITGLVALLALFVYIGGSIWLQPRFQVDTMLSLIRDHGITFVHGAPTIFIKMLEKREEFPSLPSLKKGACGSSNLPMEVLKKLHDWLPGFCMHTVFGMTETTSPATIMPGDALIIHKPGSSGIPIPGVEICIMDEKRSPVPPGSSGVLFVRGSTVIRSYWGADQETANNAIVDGWLDTGDIARIDEDGYLYLLDRKKDMINRGGEKVYSIEVENVLASHPDVAECAVVGMPDHVYGERVCAWVRLKKGKMVGEEDLKKFMYGKLATYKLPEKYCFLEQFSKNENGKIEKYKLREMLSME